MWVRSIKVLVDTLEIKKTEEEIEMFAREEIGEILKEKCDSTIGDVITKDAEYAYECLGLEKIDTDRYLLTFLC